MVYPHGLPAAGWWRHLAEFTVAVVTRQGRGRRVFLLTHFDRFQALIFVLIT